MQEKMIKYEGGLALSRRLWQHRTVLRILRNRCGGYQLVPTRRPY
ncbi:MAG: hypothetical protein JWN25_3059 [Verrucomicrobiales bacterium]|nr:hypothetical protein [Verrucomicrobiales bacterium]